MQVVPLFEAGTLGAPAPSTFPLVYNPQAKVCIDCPVRRQALFGLLDQPALERLHWRIADLTFQPGQRLYAAGEAGLAAYTLREGVVRLERTGERGERHILRLAGRADLIGLEALLGQTYANDAVACTPVRACRLPQQMVQELCQDNLSLAKALMKRWQMALDESEEWLTELMSGSARWRMLRLLLKLSEYGQADGRVWLPTRQEMGAMLGMTVETASRLVSSLKRETLVQADGPRHARLDMHLLLGALREAARSE